MSPEEAIYFAAVIAVGMTQALRRNATAIALVATWLVCRVIYEKAGHCPLQAQIISDMIVIAAMFVKEDWVNYAYRNGWHQLACMWTERTPWDRVILALFPVMWLNYFPILSTTPQCWTLWGIGLIQLGLAGHEAFHQWRKTRANSSLADAPEHPSGTLFAPVRGEAYG